MKLEIGNTDFSRIVRHELISIIIPANQQPNTLNFPDNPNLRKIHLLGMELITSEISRFDNNGITTLSVSALIGAPMYITLQNYKGQNFCENLPAIKTIPIAYSPVPLPLQQFPRDFMGQMVNFPKSQVYFPIPLPADTNNRSILFSIYYINPNLDFKNENK